MLIHTHTQFYYTQIVYIHIHIYTHTHNYWMLEYSLAAKNKGKRIQWNSRGKNKHRFIGIGGVL